MKNFKWLMVVFAIVFTGIGVWFGLYRHAASDSEQGAVASLFQQSLADLKGQQQPLSQWQGNMLLVNFWATWCTPCVQEMPELSALQTQIGGSKMQIIGIGVDTAANVHEFSKKLPVGYPLYVGGMGAIDLARQFGNQTGGLPFTVLIGADGRVRKTYLGRLKLDEVRRDMAEG